MKAYRHEARSCAHENGKKGFYVDEGIDDNIYETFFSSER